MSVSDRQLRQYLADAMTPPERAALREELAASPALQQRLTHLVVAADASPSPWRLPPPGVLGHRSIPCSVSTQAFMDGDGLKRLTLTPTDAVANHWVIVLSRDSGDWQVVFPETPEDAVRVAELTSPAGTVTLDVATTGRAAVVFVPDTLPLFDADWQAVRNAIATGQLPMTVVDLTDTAPRTD